MGIFYTLGYNPIVSVLALGSFQLAPVYLWCDLILLFLCILGKIYITFRKLLNALLILNWMSPLYRGYENLCIFPIFVYMLLKQMSFCFLTTCLVFWHCKMLHTHFLFSLILFLESAISPCSFYYRVELENRIRALVLFFLWGGLGFNDRSFY